MPGHTHTDGDKCALTSEGQEGETESGAESKDGSEMNTHTFLTGAGENCSHVQMFHQRRPQFSQDQRVYISHPVDGWIAGVVLADQPGGQPAKVEVRLDTGQISERNCEDVLLMKSDGNCLASYSNLTDLCPVNEATVLHCLCQRFEADVFYTRVGTTLMALNPCKDVPDLYGRRSIFRYHQSDDLGSKQPKVPHVYEVAENAYNAMRRRIGCVDQSIVISGESGAGKTVSTKHLLRYLTVISSEVCSDDLDRSIAGGPIEKRILVSNPILEAFGNATTPRNENSSRFGKFIQLQFDGNGAVIGGVIQTYLLEKTRVAHRNCDADDKNFHIFYQLLTMDQHCSVPYWLDSVKEAVNQSGIALSHSHSSSRLLSLLDTVEALTEIGVSCETQVDIFKILLAILHLAEIEFVPKCQGEASDISTTDKASQKARDFCCSLLQLSPLGLQQALVRRHIVSGGDSRRSVFAKACLVSEAKARRDCLMMLLYSRLFDWLVSFINKQIKTEADHQSINLLDIYGFEHFETNSLEQMCINYANERLQQFYVSHFLRDLQSEYESEGIAWTHVAYKDNTASVVAMDSAFGIFGILNEEVYLNRESDDSALQNRIFRSCKRPDVVFPVRQRPDSQHRSLFLVCHYAGEVVYDLTNTVRKNQDNVPHEIEDLLRQSINPLLQTLFNEDNNVISKTASCTSTQSGLPPVKSNKKRKTVLAKFKLSLDGLMDHLKASKCHYIRCVKPNDACTPGKVDQGFILRQLRACGTLETVDICQKGYPARMPYAEFMKRYSVLVPHNSSPAKPSCSQDPCDNSWTQVTTVGEVDSNEVNPWFQYMGHPNPNVTTRKTRKRRGQTIHNDYRSQCVSVMSQAVPAEELRHMDRQFGQSKLFLTHTQLELLEKARSTAVSKHVVKIQACWRRHLWRSRFLTTVWAARLIQAHWRGYSDRRCLETAHDAASCIQRNWKVHRLKVALLKRRQSRNFKMKALERGEDVRVKAGRRLERDQNLNFSCDVHYESRNFLGRVGAGANLLDPVFGYDCDDVRGVPSQALYHNMMTVDEFFSQESLSIPTEGVAAAACESPMRQTIQEKTNGDTDSSCSNEDPAAISIGDEDVPSTSSASDDGPLALFPPAKKPRLGLGLKESLNIGRGIATRRQLTKPGYRFHTRKSVLQYGHVAHRRYLTKGLSDALDSPEKMLDKENQLMNGYNL